LNANVFRLFAPVIPLLVPLAFACDFFFPAPDFDFARLPALFAIVIVRKRTVADNFFFTVRVTGSPFDQGPSGPDSKNDSVTAALSPRSQPENSTA